MPEFIVDANLPFKISKWQSNRFVHVLKINPMWDDDEIWNYAYHGNLIIITKDKDFRLKQIIHGSPPKVIHIKFGNVILSEFEKIILLCWEQVEELIKTHSLINIFQYYIEAIK
jgi:predicted nuclease of predicted toxin-antitoxin system